MKVNKVLQTPDGPVTFKGELSEDEADMVLGLGLNYLMKQGALPFKVLNVANLQPMPEEEVQH